MFRSGGDPPLWVPGGRAEDKDRRRRDPAERRDLALLLPSTETAFDKEGSRARFFAAVSNLLSAAAARTSVVLLIDDLQWIDEGSSSLLHYVLRTVAAPARLLFIGSARTDEIEENPWCKRLVNALTDSGALRRLALTPLGAADAAQFFARDVEPTEVADALRRSGGNPLFLTEIAKAGVKAPHRPREASTH